MWIFLIVLFLILSGALFARRFSLRARHADADRNEQQKKQRVVAHASRNGH
jgi:hypothetical protein